MVMLSASLKIALSKVKQDFLLTYLSEFNLLITTWEGINKSLQHRY